jgi:hypothetical protein
MPFDPARWPNAVRVGDLIAGRIPLGIHCGKCSRYVVADPAALPLAPESYVPALAGRFRCTRCGSRQTEARPEYSRRGERIMGYGGQRVSECPPPAPPPLR